MRLPAIVLGVFSALALAACGSDSEPASSPDVATQLKAPPPAADPAGGPASGKGAAAIAANLEQANQIIPGGQEALDAKLAELAGEPVLVNRWASWCPPCRDELPFFSESARAHASDVAFLGINTQDDSLEAAEGFLSEVPISFPSVEDTSGDVARELGIGNVSPGTAFIDASGEIAYTRQGAYASREELEADIQRYLLAG
jgi:cytochrome c biogenesis protein CcmG/thiol:disulfide interchange protein DsbE